MKGLFLGVALLVMTAGASQAGTYNFTFTGSVYDATGAFTTGGPLNADGTYDITSASGLLTSADVTLPQGAFTLEPGNAVSPSYLLSADGADFYNNTYKPGTDYFAGQGIELEGAGFAFNIYTGSVAGYGACSGTCASVPTTNYYNPGDLGTLSITAVPEPAAWAMMIGGLGLIGLVLRRRNGLESAAA
jgi:hypothetical protein